MAPKSGARAKTAAKPEVVSEEEKWVEHKCAFCRGTGRDPFGVMSVLSNCPVCGGRRTVRVKVPSVPCRACRGTGVQSSTRLPCNGCGGRGLIHVEEPTETCPLCKGTGVGGGRSYCLRCDGAGLVSK